MGGVTKKLEVAPRKSNPSKNTSTTPATNTTTTTTIQQPVVVATNITTDFSPINAHDSNVAQSTETITIASTDKATRRPISIDPEQDRLLRRRGNSTTSSTVTVRALSECFTHHHHHQYNQIKIGQSSPKLCSAEKSSSHSYNLSTSPSRLNESSDQSKRIINVNCAQPLPFSASSSSSSADLTNYHRTESKNLTDPKLSDSSAQAAAAAATNDDKSFSCRRLYDCMPIGACTARNGSCEPESCKLDSRKSSIISRTAQLSKRRFLQSVMMDRSMDSIGSCSLDVDAVSTDFSGIKKLL